MQKQNKFIDEAIVEAKKAYDQNEVPIGCVIVKDGKIIARAYNKREQLNDISSHAEINALKKASKVLNSWKLNDCELYVTVEPCLMCYSAIVQSRISKVIYLSKQQKNKKKSFREHVERPEIEMVYVENKDAQNLMSSFFQNMRKV